MTTQRAIRVLIADPSANIQHAIVQGLEPWKGGLTWITTDSGEGARDCLVKKNPDLAFIDVTNLKGMSGPEALAHARRMGNRTLSVLMSELVMPHWAAVSAEVGAYEFLRKPFSAQDAQAIMTAFYAMDKPIRILLVEPSQAARTILRKLMNESRFKIEVEETDNGPHALKLQAITSYDVVFVDMHLPGLGGLEVACQLQSRSPDLAVILMSGQKGGTLASMAEKFSIGYYLQKPFFSLDLDNVLHRILKLRRPYLMNALMKDQAARQNAEQAAALAAAPVMASSN